MEPPLRIELVRVQPPATDLPLPPLPGVFDAPVSAASLARFAASPDRILLLALAEGRIVGQLQAVRAIPAEEAPAEIRLGRPRLARGYEGQGVEERLRALAEHLLAAPSAGEGGEEGDPAISTPGTVDLHEGPRTGLEGLEPTPETPVQDRYEDQGLLGEGGTAEVRRVFDRWLRRTVAMKILHLEHQGRPIANQRFREEIQTTAQLQHPGIVPLYDTGTLPDGRPFFTMKEVRGVTLSEAIRGVHTHRPGYATGPSGLRWLVGLLRQASRAVAHAHERGVLHRDLKPANVMIGDLGEVWVMDWGLSKLPDGLGQGEPLSVERHRGATLAGRVIGTPAYMAPEQAQGRNEALDARADVYALGALLYHILEGRPPYPGESAREVVQQVRQGPPPPPVGGNEGLQRICRWAMAREPEERPRSAREFAEALDAWLEGWQLRARLIEPGTIFAQEGEPGETAWIVQEGRCEVFTVKDGVERSLGILGPGEVVGETAAVTGGRRIASVRALGPLRLTEVDRAVLAEALRLDSPLGQFVTALARRYREAELRQRQT